MNETIQTEDRLERKFKTAAYFLVWVPTIVFFFFSVIRQVFGGTVWDIGMYAAASALFGLLLSVGISRLSFLWLFRTIADSTFRQDYIQGCCFAVICLMTLYYYNSGSEYGHSLATRVMNTAFAIAILCLYRREEQKDRLLTWLKFLIPVVFLIFILVGRPDLKQGIMDFFSAVTVWFYSILLYCTGKRIARKEICTHYSWYGFLVWIFFAMIIIFRNTRTWPFSVVIPFGCLFLYPFTKGAVDRLLRNFCYGCILAFWLMFGTAILFRPYYSFEFTRYPGWFSSVASAGLFWMVAFGCTLSTILAKFRQNPHISYMYFELLTLGAVTAHVFMSASRTSILAIGAFSLTVFGLTQALQYKDSLKGMLYKLLLIVCPLFLAFPVVYTLTRCMPAVVGRPVRVTGAEWFSDMIEKHEPLDSTKFMNIAQYGEMFLEKLLGIDINLTSLTGAVSGPDAMKSESDREENVVGMMELNGQLYSVKDYTFVNDNEGDLSNGRFEIFRIYFNHLNLTGHDSMIVENADTNITLFHAHNSYMQVAYDHGVPTGILFLLVVFGGFVSSVCYYKRNREKVNFAIYPVIVVISFMIAGVTEWIFHPSIPIGFAFLFVMTPLMSAEAAKEPEETPERSL